MLVLGAVGLLCGLVAIGAVARAEHDDRSLPEAVEPPGGGWYQSLAVPRRSRATNIRTACGFRLTARADGVAHPVLPCGTRLYIAYGSVEALTQVLAHGSTAPRAQFVVTQSLARKLGLKSVDLVRWRYAKDE